MKSKNLIWGFFILILITININSNFLSNSDINLSVLNNQAYAQEEFDNSDVNNKERGTPSGNWCIHYTKEGNEIRFWVQGCPGIFGAIDCTVMKCPLES